jgi:hypothetical protein
MIKDKLQNKVFEAKMDFGNGNSSWLDVHKVFIEHKNMEEIFFIRNKHGVCAWHCGSLPVNDYRIIEIREKIKFNI